MAQRYRNRPSELLHIDDPYIAYCVDEAGAYMLAQLDEGKRPHFGQAGQSRTATDAGTAGNRETIEMMKQLGAEVRTND